MKFYGNVGFAVQEETSPGVWRECWTVRPYRGDVIRRRRKWQGTEYQNDDLNLDNEISIVADDYLNKNIPFIRYVELMGCKWKVSSVEVQFPRLLLTIGGVYNGEDATPVSL